MHRARHSVKRAREDRARSHQPRKRRAVSVEFTERADTDADAASRGLAPAPLQRPGGAALAGGGEDVGPQPPLLSRAPSLREALALLERWAGYKRTAGIARQLEAARLSPRLLWSRTVEQRDLRDDALLLRLLRLHLDDLCDAVELYDVLARRGENAVAVEPIAAEVRQRLECPGNCVVYSVNGRQSFHVGVERVRSALGAWVEDHLGPAATQDGGVVVVHGAARSGKTSEARVLVPWVLAPHVARLRHRADREGTFNERVCRMVYINLLSFAQVTTYDGKSTRFCRLVAKHVGTVTQQQRAARLVSGEDAHSLVMEMLVEKAPCNFIVTIDEYHLLFARLSRDDRTTMASDMRQLMIADGSPSVFVVAGSTNAATVQALLYSPVNGKSVFWGRCDITTDIESSARDLKDTHTLLEVMRARANPERGAPLALEEIQRSVREELDYVNCAAVHMCADSPGQAVALRERILDNYQRDYELIFIPGHHVEAAAFNELKNFVYGTTKSPRMQIEPLVSQEIPGLWTLTDPLFREFFAYHDHDGELASADILPESVALVMFLRMEKSHINRQRENDLRQFWAKQVPTWDVNGAARREVLGLMVDNWLFANPNESPRDREFYLGDEGWFMTMLLPG
eukprot:m51a1_g906 hypothetical protein (630) ;mRNA; r:94101-99909